MTTLSIDARTPSVAPRSSVFTQTRDLPAPTADPPAPAATTLAATDVATTTATFHAKVDPNSTPTTGYFVYGTAPDQLTQHTPVTSLGAGSGWIVPGASSSPGATSRRSRPRCRSTAAGPDASGSRAGTGFERAKSAAMAVRRH
jgi:hypothetical protein